MKYDWETSELKKWSWTNMKQEQPLTLLIHTIHRKDEPVRVAIDSLDSIFPREQIPSS